MAETVRQGLRDLLASLEEREEILDEMLREADAAAVARARAAPRLTQVGFQAPWITGQVITFLDFGRGGPFGGGRAAGSPGGGG